MISQKEPPADALAVILRRRSVRDYTGQTVEREKLETILRAGMSAPTAVNRQPWAYVAVTARPVLDRLRDGLPHARMLGRAGTAIVVCAMPEEAFEQRIDLAVIDSSLASENMLLAADALGLGAVWVAAYPYRERMEFIRSVLNIPENALPLNVISIGYPAGKDHPVDKFKPEKIHWESW
jgi:nitroreductase